MFVRGSNGRDQYLQLHNVVPVSITRLHAVCLKASLQVSCVEYKTAGFGAEDTFSLSNVFFAVLSSVTCVSTKSKASSTLALNQQSLQSLVPLAPTATHGKFPRKDPGAGALHPRHLIQGRPRFAGGPGRSLWQQ
jgi:hypothetical protein